MAAINGTSGNDLLIGTPDPDEILGFTGDDSLQGLAGNDTINGGQDQDFLQGGSGDDLLLGDIGNDTLEGESGNDSLTGNVGNDQLDGGEGDDQIHGGQGSDTLRSSSGNDRLFGDRGNDVLYIGAGDDSLSGGGGSDVFVLGRELIDSQVDIITDFRIGVDLIGLTNNLRFADLRFIQVGNDAVIEDTVSNQRLVIVQEVNASTLNNAANFTQSIEQITPIIELANNTALQVREGSTTSVPITVRRAGSPFNGVGATLALELGTATAGDVNLETFEVAFAPYETFKQVLVPLNVTDDQQFEPNESLKLILSNPSGGATLGEDKEISVNIQDNDSAGQPSQPQQPAVFIPPSPTSSQVIVSISPSEVAEESGAGLVYTFTRQGGSLDIPITVDFTVGGTAKFGENYTQTGASSFSQTQGTVAIPANATTTTVTITPINDTIFQELGQTIELTLKESGVLYTSNPQQDVATGTITNDDLPPAPPVYNFSQSEFFIFEGEPTVTRTAEITVQRSFDTSIDSSVNIILEAAPVNGATPGEDFQPQLIPVVFLPGDLQKTVTVNIIGDDATEPSEVANLRFADFAPNGQAGGANPQATLTINDDDGPTTYDFTQAFFQALEGNASNVTQVVTISRTGDINVDSSVNVNLTGVNATPEVDFAPGPIIVNFQAGETEQTVPITVIGDLATNQNKTINLSLTPPEGTQVGNLHPRAELLVIDDDNVPTYDFTRADYRVREGTNSVVNFNEITVIRSGKVDIASNVTVNLTAASLNGAIPDQDFRPAQFNLQFAPGETSKTLNIEVTGDETSESSEGITLSFTNADNSGQPGTTFPTSTLTIDDDDSPPTYNFAEISYEAQEGNTTNIVTRVEVRRSGDISQASGVDVLLTGNNATPGTDFTRGPINVQFAVNETTKIVPISIIGNTRVQGNRTIDLSFANFTNNGRVGEQIPTTTFTIADDDIAQVGITAAQDEATEPLTTKVQDERPQDGVYRISRTPDDFGNLPVNLTVTGNKISPNDYTLKTRTGEIIPVTTGTTGGTAVVTIPNGQSSIEVVLTPTDDLAAEAAESLTLTLAQSNSYRINPEEQQATVTILANDTVVTTLTDSTSTSPENYGLVEGSLRQALLNAQSLQGEDTITFAESASSGAVKLAGALPAISTDLIIRGPGADKLSIERGTGGEHNIFTVNGGNVTFQGLKLTNGFPAGTLPSVNNTTTGSRGGAINITSSFSNVQVVDSWLTGNRANNGGAIANSGQLKVINSTISNNQASNGGGIIVIDGQVEIVNSTLTENKANIGGGIFNSIAGLTLTNSTIARNDATSNGGGVRNIGGVTNLKNTIIAQNTAPLSPDAGAGADFPFNSGGNNLIGNGEGENGIVNGVNNDIVGTAATPIDPLLTPLQNNGGAIPTLALGQGSPGINAGNNTFTSPYIAPGSFDQRGSGFARIINNIIDMGAFESQLI